MRGKTRFLLIGALCIGSVQAGQTLSTAQLDEVQAFLAKYAALGAAQAPDFYDLYSDRALIHVRAAGHTDEAMFRGVAYKAWSRELLAAQRIGIDASEFHEGVVEDRRGRFVIRAKRFSRSHCAWDVDYQVALEREAENLKIVEERISTSSNAVCARSGPSTTLEGEGGGRVYASNPQPPSWRPLTQEEITRSALQLAKEWAARNPPKSQVEPVATGRSPPPADPNAVLITSPDP